MVASTMRLPGMLPRAIASAAEAPSTVAATVVSTATSRLNPSACMKSRAEKNFSNQRSETPTGGNWMNGVGLSANTNTIAIGASMNTRTAMLAAR
jgi:hypothetical protein